MASTGLPKHFKLSGVDTDFTSLDAGLRCPHHTCFACTSCCLEAQQSDSDFLSFPITGDQTRCVLQIYKQRAHTKKIYFLIRFLFGIEGREICIDIRMYVLDTNLLITTFRLVS